MNAHQQRVLFSFRRVVTFVDERPRLTAGNTSEAAAIATQINALRDIVNRTASNAAAQLTLSAAATHTATDEPVLKHALVDHHLRSIVKVARGLRGVVPGIGLLIMPNNSLRSAGLIEYASAFATQAAVYSAVLIEHGLPADFIAQLRAAIDAFQASITARGVARNNVKGASRSIARDIVLGRRIITVLDGVISRHLVTEEHDLVVWNAAKRIGTRISSVQSIPLPDTSTPFVAQQTSSNAQVASGAKQQAA